MKSINPDDEATVQRFITFAHAFSDIKSLEFPDENIESQLVNGFIGSLPDAPSQKGTGPCVGWVIAVKEKPNGLSRKLGLTIYETYSNAVKSLTDCFITPQGNEYFRHDLAPYSNKEDYEIVPLYR